MAIPVVSDVVGAIAGAAVKVVSGAVKPILDKIAGDKMSEAEKAQVQLELEQAMRAGVLAEQEQFYAFVVQHTGAAADMPRLIQIVRGLVRPVVTFYVVGLDGWVIWKWFNTPALPQESDAFLLMLKLLLASTIIVLGFWFGERLVTRSGIVQVVGGALTRRRNGETED